MCTPTIDMAATGARIKSMRIGAGIKVSDIQTAMGFSTPQAIYAWQRGSSLPTLDNLVILASIFHVKLDDIVVCSDT